MEGIDESFVYEIPIHEAFTIFVYLNGEGIHHNVQIELFRSIGFALDNTVIVSGNYGARPLPKKVSLSGAAIKEIGGLVITDMMETMRRRFHKEAKDEGGTIIGDDNGGPV